MCIIIDLQLCSCMYCAVRCVILCYFLITGLCCSVFLLCLFLFCTFVSHLYILCFFNSFVYCLSFCIQLSVSLLLLHSLPTTSTGGHPTAVNKHITSHHVMSCHHDSCSERHQTNKCTLPLFHSLYPLPQKWHYCEGIKNNDVHRIWCR